MYVDNEEAEDKTVSLRAYCGHGLCSGQPYVLLFGRHEQIPWIMILFGLTKSRRIRWTEHMAPMDGKNYMYRVLMRQPKGNTPLGRPRRRRSALTGFTRFRIGSSEGFCERGNETSCSLKCTEFRDWLRIFWLLKKDYSTVSQFVVWLVGFSVS
jgi:hypothetical protein